MSNIKVIKLSTGEELIASVIHHIHDKSIDLHDPLLIVQQFDPRSGRMNLQMFKWLPYRADPKQPLTIQGNHVIIETQPSQDMTNNYIKATTGISQAKEESEDHTKRIIQAAQSMDGIQGNRTQKKLITP